MVLLEENPADVTKKVGNSCSCESTTNNDHKQWPRVYIMKLVFGAVKFTCLQSPSSGDLYFFKWPIHCSCVFSWWWLKCFFNVYLFLRERERERQSVSRGGAERGRGTESEAGSRLWAVSTEPNAVLELVNCKILTWAEVWRPTYRATQAPWQLHNFWRKVLYHYFLWSEKDKLRITQDKF